MARRKRDPANPYVRSLTEGLLRIASSGSKLPALGFSLATRELNTFNKLTGNDQIEIPENLLDNSVTRSIDNAIASNSYIMERFPEDNLLSLIQKKDYAGAGEYIAHQVIANAPQQIALATATVFGAGTPALVTLASLSAAEAIGKGANSGADPLSQSTNAIINGASEAIFERIGTVGIVKSLQANLIKRFGKDAAKTTMRSMSKELAKSVIKAGAVEGLEEAATAIAQNTSENLTGVDQNDLKDILADTLESAVVGAVSGGVFTTPISTIKLNQLKSKEKAVKKAVETFGGEYRGSTGDITDPKNMTYHFFDSEGLPVSVTTDKLSFKEIGIKADVKLDQAERYIDESIEEIDVAQITDIQIKSDDYKGRLLKATNNKHHDAAKLDELLYLAADFAEDPGVLDKVVEVEKIDEPTGKRFKTKERVGETLKTTNPTLFAKYLLAQNLYHQIKEGKADTNVISVFNDVLADFQKQGAFYLQAGMIRKTRQVYVPHSLEADEGVDGSKSKRDRAFGYKERQYDTLAEAVIATGKAIKTRGLTANHLNYSNYMIERYATKKLKDKLIYDGIIEREDDLTPEKRAEYQPIALSDETFAYKRPTGKQIQNPAGEMVDEIVTERYYAPKPIARSLNVVFEDTKLRKNKVLTMIRKVNAISKASRLLYSFFHFNAFGLSYMLSTPDMYLRVKQGVEDRDMKRSLYAINNMINPFAGIFGAYKDGLKMWQEGSPVVKLLVKNGLTLGRNQEWDEAAIHQSTSFSRQMDKRGLTRYVKNAVIKAHDRFANLLFKKVGAGLKIMNSVALFEEQKRKNPNLTDDQAAQLAAEISNYNFGGLHLKRMRRNPTAQYIWQIFAFAPDWTESNFRLYASAILGSNDTKKAAYRASAIRIITRGFIATALLQLLSAAMREPDEDERKRKQSLLESFTKNYAQAWKDGRLTWIKTNVNPFLEKFGFSPNDRYYYGFMSFYLDPTKWVSRDITKGGNISQSIQDFFTPERLLSSLGKSAYYKAAAVPQIIGDFLLDTDYTFYRDFNNFDELIDKGKISSWNKSTFKPKRLLVSPEQLPSYALYESQKFVPIPVMSAVAFMLGNMEGSELVLNLAGQDVKRAYAKKDS